MNDERGLKKSIGDNHYRAFVGPPEKYDIIGASQFNLLTNLGLREHHFLLDIGCGSLRGGRLFIPYLLSNHYFGIEPEKWLVKEGIEKNLGRDILTVKNPTFDYNNEFNLSIFNQKFDYVLAQSIFSHASEKQIKDCLNEVKKVLNLDGLFLATFFLGKTNYEKDTWAYPEAATYTLEKIETVIKNSDFHLKKLNWRHPNNQTWFAIGEESEILKIQET